MPSDKFPPNPPQFPEDDEINKIEEKMKQSKAAPLSNALSVLARLSDEPSNQKVVDFVNKPLEEWLQLTNKEWLNIIVFQEAEICKKQGMDSLYSEAVLKSLYGRLKESDPLPKGIRGEKFLAYVSQKMRESELYRGFHRIWAKNLSRSQVETIYFHATKNAKVLLREIESKLLVAKTYPDSLKLDNYTDLFKRRDSLYGAQMILLDWEQINDTDLNESHNGENNLATIIKKIDQIGDQLLGFFGSASEFSRDERLYRISQNDPYQPLDNNWWMRATNWEIDRDNEIFMREYTKQQMRESLKKAGKNSDPKKNK